MVFYRFENISTLKNEKLKNPAKFLLIAKWKQSQSFTFNETRNEVGVRKKSVISTDSSTMLTQERLKICR